MLWRKVKQGRNIESARVRLELYSYNLNAISSP